MYFFIYVFINLCIYIWSIISRFLFTLFHHPIAPMYKNKGIIIQRVQTLLCKPSYLLIVNRTPYSSIFNSIINKNTWIMGNSETLIEYILFLWGQQIYQIKISLQILDHRRNIQSLGLSLLYPRHRQQSVCLVQCFKI